MHPDPDYKLGGIGEVLAALQGEDDDPLEGLLRKTLREHDMYSSPGNPYVDPERWKMFIDPCLDDEGNKTLPKWSPDDPHQSNVIYGLIASARETSMCFGVNSVFGHSLKKSFAASISRRGVICGAV